MVSMRSFETPCNLVMAFGSQPSLLVRVVAMLDEITITTLTRNSWQWPGWFSSWDCEEFLGMVQVALGSGLIKDLGNCQCLFESGFGEPFGDYIIFICYLAASIEVHSTSVKKQKILFLSKRTFLRLSISSFLTKLAYVL